MRLDWPTLAVSRPETFRARFIIHSLSTSRVWSRESGVREEEAHSTRYTVHVININFKQTVPAARELHFYVSLNRYKMLGVMIL